MLRVVAAVLLGLAFCGAASAHTEKLTPSESVWAKPLLQTWSTMNAGLNDVVKEASASDALYAGSPNNGKLVKTLASFVECSAEVKKQGAPPSARLKPFDTSLVSMCAHLGTGANDVAKAVGAITKGDSALAKQRITAGYGEFVQASTFLKQAAGQIVKVAGQDVLAA